jgi:hypothetical protein
VPEFKVEPSRSPRSERKPLEPLDAGRSDTL